jgi:hypothetical protein
MGAGITLTVIGAILAFAVRADPKGISLPTVGVIFMLAGGFLIYVSRRNHHHKVITSVEPSEDPRDPPHVHTEGVARDIDD